MTNSAKRPASQDSRGSAPRRAGLYDGRDERSRGLGQNVERDEPLYRLALRRAIRDTGLQPMRGELPRLPGTRREGEAVRALAGARQSQLITDFAATPAAAESEEMSQYRYVLFATHGLIDSQNPNFLSLRPSSVPARWAIQSESPTRL